MANYVKGNVQFTPVVEQINRKWATKKTKCSAPKTVGPVKTVSNSWMGSGTTQLYRAGLGSVKRNFFIFRENARTSTVNAAELMRRSAFTEGNKWANAAWVDLMAIATNQARFIFLRDNPRAYIAITGGEQLYAAGYSFKGFLRAYAIKEKAAVGGTLPQDHIIPEPVVPA